MSENLKLFTDLDHQSSQLEVPLAERLRPSKWEDYEWLQELDPSLKEFLEKAEGLPPSLILWGPPGCGKTTLAKLIGVSFDCAFIAFSAVLGGVKEVREIVEQAKHRSKASILFVDEIHRFNKAQQDAFLPHVEAGTIILIGATTENPSFSLNAALLSRARVLSLPSLSEQALVRILERALPELGIKISQAGLVVIANAVGGDARQALNILEAISKVVSDQSELDQEAIAEFIKAQGHYHYDRDGEEHYNMISAFIKSLRGSDPDAALYWGFRMLESGEDPRFIFRRLIIFASEDIGNADPRAIQLAVATAQAFEQIGFPEGKIPLAQCITYLASAPKSNRSYVAMNKVLEKIKQNPKVEVPKHLRNAPTKLMQAQGYAVGYQYPHDSETGYIRGEQYLPDQLLSSKFYEPSSHGYEKSILERFKYWKGNSD